MKKIILNIIILISLVACSQKEKTMLNQNIKITSDNIIDEISKQVKHYPSEKIYNLGYSNDKCYFEMFVNGIKIEKKFNRPLAGSTAVEINHLLFKSGQYKIDYKMYPLGKVQQYEEVFTTLVEGSNVEFDLSSYDLQRDQDRDINYTQYSVPKVEKKISEGYSEYTFEGAGKTFYEGSFNINVDVPYELKQPFENAKDLRKMDRKELETKLLKKYREVKDIYQNKEYDNIARLEYDVLKMLYVSHYDSKETISENITILFDKIYKSSSFEMQPIENYKLEFFADGKLAALMLDTTDNKLRGNTALWAKVDYDGGVRGMFINRYFYIREGEAEFEVY